MSHSGGVTKWQSLPEWASTNTSGKLWEISRISASLHSINDTALQNKKTRVGTWVCERKLTPTEKRIIADGLPKRNAKANKA